MGIEINPEEDFHVVLNGVVTALSLNALDAAYDGEVIREDTLIWQQGLDEWMRLDTLLAVLENQEQFETAAAQAAAQIADDIYYVLVAPEEVKKMSLDLLDDSYRLDIIDLDTLIWQPGYSEWVPLAVVLGAADAVPHYSVAPSLGPKPTASGYSMNNQVVSQQAPTPVSAYPGANPSAPHSVYPSQAPRSVSAIASVIPEDIPLPPPAPRASPWFRRSFLAVAAFTFAFILHRNGLSDEIAASIDKSDELLALEQKLGPSRKETPHELARWLSNLQQNYALGALSETEAVPGAAISPQESSADDSNKTEPGGTSESASPPLPGAPAAAGSDKSVPGPDEGQGKATDFGNILSGKKSESPVAPAKKPAYRPKKSKNTSSGLAHDPMNGTL